MTEAPHESNRMRLLRELVPTVNSIAVLLNPARPVFDAQSKAFQETARAVTLEIQILPASSEPEIGSAFTIARRAKAGCT
jgi:putative tryptophan/tyrosine transport system substrate-binding protein